MSIFIDRFGKSIAGVLSGLDRAVFRGFIQSFVYPRGMFQYLCSRKVLLKDFTAWAKPITEEVKSRFTEDAAKSGHEVTYIRASSASKEEMAREAQEERQITRGIIGSWSCVEPCRSWTIFKNRDTKRMETRIEPGQCLHLYRYWDHEDFGFMHVRLQTWFPFSIQICMNGRESVSYTHLIRALKYQSPLSVSKYLPVNPIWFPYDDTVRVVTLSAANTTCWP